MSQNPGPGEDAVGVGLQGENQQQEVQVLSLENIAAVIKAGVKEAVGEVKENLKSYIEDEFSAAKSKVLESTKYKFKWKGNEVQFNFNSKQKEGVDKAIQKIQKGETAPAISELQKVKTEFDSRNKLIKLADKTEHGWKVVDEYEKEELAADSGDEKRIKKAIKDAAAKQNLNKPKKATNPRRFAPYNSRSAPETAPNPYSHNFRRFSGMRQQSTYGSARPTDICFGCGKYGHWRRNCPGYGKTTTDKNTGQQTV